MERPVKSQESRKNKENKFLKTIDFFAALAMTVNEKSEVRERNRCKTASRGIWRLAIKMSLDKSRSEPFYR